MAEQSNVLLAEVRTKTGKGHARRARVAGKIPAVMYGRGIDPVHLDLPGHETFLIVKDSANAVVTVKYEGKQQFCLVKHIQVHPVHRNMLHIDLLALLEGDKVQVDVPIILVGEAAAGTQHQQEEFSLLVNAPATSIPEAIEVDVSGLLEGTVVRVADLHLPANVDTDVDPKRDIVSILGFSRAEDDDAAADADA